jgi:3',5'-cyclic AMP phosphodiesterase CpdA
MKLQIFSDIHLETSDYTPAQPAADTVVLAGDIHVGRGGIGWIKKHFPEKPVIYVAGNHEFYGNSVRAQLNELRSAAEGSNICFLENESIQVGDFTFLGCTLWTDFKAWANPKEAMLAAKKGIRDFNDILGRTDWFHPEDSVVLHQQSFDWLKDELKKHPPEKTVVLTHHAPSEKSIPPQHVGDILNGAFVSPLDDFVKESGVPLWVHGHTHYSVDYKIGKTRVFSNQRGYAWDKDKHFKPDAVIELSTSGIAI